MLEDGEVVNETITIMSSRTDYVKARPTAGKTVHKTAIVMNTGASPEGRLANWYLVGGKWILKGGGKKNKNTT